MIYIYTHNTKTTTIHTPVHPSIHIHAPLTAKRKKEKKKRITMGKKAVMK